MTNADDYRTYADEMSRRNDARKQRDEALVEHDYTTAKGIHGVFGTLDAEFTVCLRCGCLVSLEVGEDADGELDALGLRAHEYSPCRQGEEKKS